VGYEYRKLKDDVRATATVTEKHAHVGTLSAFGDARDGLGGGGLTQATVMLSQGQLGFDSPGAEAIDAQGAKTAGSYSKVHQRGAPAAFLSGFMLNLSLRGQWTDGNLDSSEKFSLGGPYGVRAFASSEALGDRGWLGSIELRYAFSPSIVGSVFHDHGEVSVNARPYLSTPNTLRRSGNGFGLTGSYGSFDWRASVAWRDGKAGTAEPDRLPRMWAQAGWRF
jgi:hemolysin activation/secretion protein